MAARKKAKKAPAKKKAAAKKQAPAVKKKPAITKPLRKNDLINSIAESTNLSKKQVGSVLEALEENIERSLRVRGARQFQLPGLLRIQTVKVKARKARTGRNIRTGEEITIPARKAYWGIKVKPFKRLRDMPQ